MKPTVKVFCMAPVHLEEGVTLSKGIQLGYL